MKRLSRSHSRQVKVQRCGQRDVALSGLVHFLRLLTWFGCDINGQNDSIFRIFGNLFLVQDMVWNCVAILHHNYGKFSS